MALLDNILAALDRWEEWRNMRAAPERLDALERRVKLLEDQLGDSSGGNRCEHCGSRNIRAAGSRTQQGHFGVRETQYKCLEENCGKQS